MKRKSIFFLLALLFIGIGCSDEESRKPYLVSAESYLYISKTTLKSFIQSAGIDVSSEDLKYDVELFKVTYHTTYKGQEITNSGLVSLPATTDPVGMLSFQHGTMVANAEAPSLTPTSNRILFLYAALASPGFIAVIPDYTGFGSSSQLMHPYFVEEATATAVIDNLRAGKELALREGLSFDKKLFLAGYSQGGYATMATHKALEEQPLDGFNLVASFPAAGGYDVKGMQEYFFSIDSYSEPFYIAYVAQAYRVYYDWTEPLSDFFNEPFAGEIPNLFDGSKTGSEINQALTEDVHDLINPNLLEGIDESAQYAYIVDAFNDNSLLDWIPSRPVYMYHGDADITVPYQNSVDTYDRLLDNGASPSVVHFTTLPGDDHESGVFSYLEEFIPIMLSLR